MVSVLFIFYINLLVEDWNLYEQLLSHSYEQMRVDTKELPIICTEVSWITRKEREKIAELVFEKGQAPAFYLGKNSVLSAWAHPFYQTIFSFAHSKTTALVLDSGHGMTSVVPVYDGHVLKKSKILCNCDD